MAHMCCEDDMQTIIVPAGSLRLFTELLYDCEECNAGRYAPSKKQFLAWEAFRKIDPEKLRNALVAGLADFDTKLSCLEIDDEVPRYGPVYSPVLLRKAIDGAILSLKNKNPDDEICFNDVYTEKMRIPFAVVPKQHHAAVRFVLIYLNLDCPDKEGPFELEALFVNEALLFVGEHSGLWTRIEWGTDFNTPDFDMGKAAHPYEGM